MGGIGGVLPNMAAQIAQFVAGVQLRTRIIDQIFLREKIWPLIHEDVFIHDSQFASPKSREFPKFAVLASNRHVGQDQSIFS